MPSTVVATLLACYVGLGGSFWQAETLRVGAVPLPYGLVIGLALTVALVVAASAFAASRVGAGVALAGWLLPVVVIGAARPEGDVVLVAAPAHLAWTAYAWTYGGLLLGAVVVGLPSTLWRAWLGLDAADPG